MKENKLKWYIADKEYINYLKKFDDKVENINYKDRLKPYLGILININNMNYYVPISSAKEKHYKMNENIDFIKIMKQERLLGVLNLNNMVPIADEHIRILKYKEIDKYRKFKNNNERDLYISFINLELKLINDKIEKIKASAIKLYTEKIARPSSKISRRCCDFKLLENKCKEYKKEKKYEKLDIYNENRIKTGKIIERKENAEINENEFVLAVQCWTINSQNKILLTKRRKDKSMRRNVGTNIRACSIRRKQYSRNKKGIKRRNRSYNRR